MKVVYIWQFFTFSLTLPAAEGQANKNPPHILLSLASQFIFHHSSAMLSIAPAYIVVTSPIPARHQAPSHQEWPSFFYLSLVPCDSLEGVTLYWSMIRAQFNIARSLWICTIQIKSYIFLCVAGRFSPSTKKKRGRSHLPADHSCNRAGYEIISEIVSHVFLALPSQSCNSLFDSNLLLNWSFALGVKSKTTSLELDRINSWPLANPKRAK